MGMFDGAVARAKGAAGRAKEWLKAPELPDWWRRSDKSAERAAVATRADAFLPNLYSFLAGSAWFLEFGFAALWALRANGEFDWTYRFAIGDPLADWWSFAFAAHVVPAFLTTYAVAVIVAISVTWIPVYNALAGMGRWRRASVLVVGPLCTAIAVMGAIVVQVENVSMDARDAAIVQQQGQQDRATIERQIASIDQRLRDMRDRRVTNEYAALAASVGAARYRTEYISPEALARERDPGRRELLRRAVGAAEQADQLEAQRARLENDLRAAPVAAQLESTTSEVRTGYILGMVQWASDNRVVAIGLTLSLIGLLCLWQAQGLREANKLLDPDAPLREKAEESAAAAAPPADPAPAPTSAPEPPLGGLLDLPPLPDLRGQPDPDFDGLDATVDEEGRALRKFAGWRAAPKARSDARRAPEPAPAAPADDDAPLAANSDDDGDLGDIMNAIRSQAQPAEPAAQE